MRGEERRQRAMLTVIDPEKRVPKDHPIQRIKQLVAAIRADIHRRGASLSVWP